MCSQEEGWRDALLMDALDKGQRVCMRATSWSMFPVIMPGERLSVERGSLQRGDIALVFFGGCWITHYVTILTSEKICISGYGVCWAS